ncbi:serine/threonine-protein kinase 11-interacting protein isoform X2 [Pristis pectinata]|uniref:serine/threonine-protein kinase 11-interacting protein isoform X2 n=1 Tax=Pristis pectinata TaxID=685728 RepID=UPI00223D9DB7|nr:serine/threonine-protein kinase 11-interacting protein isoform X2 [Pristis pectinata]
MAWLLVTRKPLIVAWLEDTETPERYPSQKIHTRRAIYSTRRYTATMASRAGEEVFVQNLTKLLRNYGDSVLSGTSTLSLLTIGLQILHQLFEQHLLARKYQHGFVALPSHPSDTASVLDVQFLFDVLQKTISLKLVHPPGPNLQTPVKIFAFKSLRFLELKRVPPHCLEGLRGVYTRLEILVCSCCINTIEEIISVCGGDLSSALPWLDLHTLNFSNNFITSLDNSLGLLNVLRTLDLSHNRIRECAENLTLLSELEYVNLSYNLLEKVPVFNSCSRVQLVTLLLRNNELDDIGGLEQLSHLKCLDLAYNVISEHANLAPLSHLHRLKELFLEGNPVYYLKNHRACTIYHLSPKAAFMRLVLDGEPVTMAELNYLPKSGRLIGRHSPRGSVLKNVLESSTPSDHNDCLPSPDSVGGPLTKKKSKVKVRAASISEPSDSDLEVRKKVAPSHMVLQHQEDIKRMDELRGQIGDDWLRYQHYLNSPDEEVRREPAVSSSAKDEADTSASILMGSGSLGDVSEDSADPGKGEEATLTTTLQDDQGECTPSSYLAPEDGACADESVTIVEKREEEPVRDVCQPFIVGRVVEEDPDLENSWIFLRVTEDELLEVDLMNADILERLELSTLTAIHTAEEFWESRGRLLPTVECCFSYIRRDKRKRKYVIMDTNPQEASQTLIKILTEALEAKQQSESEAFSRLQCLKCRHEFEELQKTSLVSGSPAIGREGNLDHPEIEDSSPALPPCPKCASDHVIILPTKMEVRTSTPVLPEEGEPRQDLAKIPSVDTDPTGSLKSVESLGGASVDIKPDAPGDESLAALSTDPENCGFAVGKSASFYLECEHSYSSISTRDGSRLSDSSGGVEPVPGASDLSALRVTRVTSSPGLYGTQLSQKGSTNSLSGSLTWSYRYSTPVGSTLTRNSPCSDGAEDTSGPSKGADFNLSVEDFQTIDHRLKLFLDVEIFSEDKEEYQCFVKASTVKFGSPEEYASLLIMSNFNVYILEITGLPSGQPSNWLRKREVHLIQDLVYLQVGLRNQSIGMEFDSSGSSYTLLIRNPSKCKNFIQFFTDMVRELTPKSVSKLKSISFTRMDPQHKLWPLIQEHPTADSTEGKRPNYLYVLAFLLQDDVLSPVTMLATSSTLHLLTEDHQWRKVTSKADNPAPSEILIKESQPISNISSVSLYQSAPHDVRLHIYHEVSRTESTWHLRTECAELVNGLVAWVREYWEDMFGVALKITAHQVPD